jgi:hypothetical protein
MIVYLLINTVTEKCYVGQTIHSLQMRLNGHWEDAKSGSKRSKEKAKQNELKPQTVKPAA